MTKQLDIKPYLHYYLGQPCKYCACTREKQSPYSFIYFINGGKFTKAPTCEPIF
jgi:hypothetical protein